MKSMELIIKGEPKEIADLVLQLQSRQNNFLYKRRMTSPEQRNSITNHLSNEDEKIKSSICVLSGLLGYSERLGLVSDINTNDCRECYAKEYRASYENALKTAIEVLKEMLNAC